MGERIIQVDAFTTERFRGNPAAVCLLNESRDADWMAAVAREMNLSETAFLLAQDDEWSLRWFTPAVEVDLCGHATLASAHVLWEQGVEDAETTLRFRTRSGLLEARRETAGPSGAAGGAAEARGAAGAGGAAGAIVLDFPAEPATRIEAPPDLLTALGIDSAAAVARNRFDYLVEVRDDEQVLAVAPDMARLATVETRGVIVTAPAAADSGHDFVSRWFGPRVGVAEDPVTGSAHCCLGPWWAERLGRRELRGYQASARGGSVVVRVLGDRVELVGRAVTVMRGELVP